MEPSYFNSAETFRRWLLKHHTRETELWVGFYKTGSGHANLSWQEAVDQALCFGWIDGVRKRVDDQRYTIRFTPRKLKSNWSTVNIGRAQQLISQGLMHEAGLQAFAARKENTVSMNPYEQRSIDLPGEYWQLLKQNRQALDFFETQPASYRKAVFWVDRQR
jgi:uncharacterized protein YdeI (YjbR/CyaY-like superfamily)